MYELKHASPAGLIRRGRFDIEKLERQAVMKFARCPKFLTLATHVNLADETPIHCLLQVSNQSVAFFVPKQSLVVKVDPDGHRYTLLNVTDSEGSAAKLIVREYDRRGILLVDEEV